MSSIEKFALRVIYIREVCKEKLPQIITVGTSISQRVSIYILLQAENFFFFGIFRIFEKKFSVILRDQLSDTLKIDRRVVSVRNSALFVKLPDQGLALNPRFPSISVTGIKDSFSRYRIDIDIRYAS